MSGVWSRPGYACTADGAALCSTDHIEQGQHPRGEGRNKDGPIEQAWRVADSLGREVFKDAEYFLTSPLRLDAKSGLLLGGVRKYSASLNTSLPSESATLQACSIGPS